MLAVPDEEAPHLESSQRQRAVNGTIGAIVVEKRWTRLDRFSGVLQRSQWGRVMCFLQLFFVKTWSGRAVGLLIWR
jgi:hypothetical protein